MKKCKYCFGYMTDLTWIARDPEALEWLKISNNDICDSCCVSLRTITERVNRNFLKRFNVMDSMTNVVPYEKISKEIKIWGWVAFLQDTLRDYTFGHYMKKRLEKHINPEPFINKNEKSRSNT